VRQFRARLLPTDSENWLANSKLSLDDDAPFQREDEYLTLVRLHLQRMRQARPTDLRLVLRFLEQLLTPAQESARIGSVIEILLLQSLTLHLLGQVPEALQKFNQSLTLAEPEGYTRLFLDEGAPAAELLVLAIQNNLHPEYANRLLALMKSSQPVGDLSEPLTEREGEVLRLLATGLSNQEIAERLVISLSTIKTHVTRIYGKLGVTSRTLAILRAQELKII
jgi:LuxR family maltose regulon positive regulatory protein